MESTPTEQVSSVLHKYYSELVSTVGKHLNGLLVHLVSEGVIKIDDKNTIKKLGDAPSERAEYLLDNHVDRPLSAGITDNFVKLLKVMQKISGCSPLAAKLSEALKCVALSDTSVNSNRRVGDETSKNNQSGMAIHIQRTLLRVATLIRPVEPSTTGIRIFDRRNLLHDLLIAPNKGVDRFQHLNVCFAFLSSLIAYLKHTLIA